MTFNDKLNFLIKVTQISNKDLAAEMAVDRSLISLLRNGKRGLPRNRIHVKHMARCFANRITADYQRQALAEMTNQPSLRAEMTPDVLAFLLERWLTGEMDIIEKMVEGLDKDSEAFLPAPEPVSLPAEKTVFYFGDEGKRSAVRHFVQLIGDGPVGIDDTSDLSWAISDFHFAQEIQSLIKRHLKKGNIITHILPPLTNIDSYTDGLKFMLPIYASGLAKVMYYPRIKSSLYCHTLAAAPGQCVLFSYGLYRGGADTITIVSCDKNVVNAHAKQLQEYLSMCLPALSEHQNPKEYTQILSDIYYRGGNIIQMSAPLSAAAMPRELAEAAAAQSTQEIWKKAFGIAAENAAHFEERLEKHTFTDICRISSPENIRSGKVPICCPYSPYEGHPFYTPETYVMHLKNILRLLNTYENYRFVPISAELWQDFILVVNDGGMALLMKADNPPPMMLEFKHPEMVESCKEYLFEIAEREGYTGFAREKIKERIKALITELEK